MKLQTNHCSKSEIEDILSRINSHQSVQGYIITNQKGEIIRTTYVNERKTEGDKIISFIPELVFKTQITVQNLEKNVRFCVYECFLE